VGGLEPPTSASQTRRAGRLRYTPADKSIIPSMHKRQAIKRSIFYSVTRLLLSLMIGLLGLVACLPNTPSAPTQTVSPTATLTPGEFKPTNQPTKTTTPVRLTSKTPTASPTANCRTYGGELQNGQVYSNQLEADFSYLIYLPPCYHNASDLHFPVLYLLHGLTHTNQQWLQLGLLEVMDSLIADGTIAPFIIVLPQESVFEPPQTSQFSDALVEELIPWVDQHYQTLPDKAFRGIGGLSRGAAWAVRIGFTHDDLFASVSAHSLPLFEADGANVNTWLIQEPKEDLPLFFIDIGRSDPEWQTAQTFTNQLNDHNIPHEWYLFQGGHDEAYWSSHLEQYLRWHARNW
jgi:enterochelin esterase-like enzyme